jgi:hypothetical protein
MILTGTHRQVTALSQIQHGRTGGRGNTARCPSGSLIPLPDVIGTSGKHPDGKNACVTEQHSSRFDGMALYDLQHVRNALIPLRALQKILATWTGACSICGQPTPTPEPPIRT